MSFKIFTLQLTGKLRPAEKIEAERKRVKQDYQAFLEAENSPELKEFLELREWVNSGVPEQVKRDLGSQVFKGSQEYNLLREFENLKKNRSLRDYFKVAGSSGLKRFEKIGDSDKLRQFWELKDYAEGGRYEQEKKEIVSQRYKGSAEEKLAKELAQLKKNKALTAYFRMCDSPALKDHLQFQKSEKLRRFLELKNASTRDQAARREFNQLRKDSSIAGFFRMEKSRDLKYYHKMAGRHVLGRYEELVSETSSESFRQRVDYLKDTKKLERSECYKKMAQFRDLAASEDIQFYRKFKKSALYRNYLDTRDSFQLGRYNELAEITGSEDFLKRKSYLEDPRKWEKTAEYARLQQFERLGKHPKVLLWQKFANSQAFDFLKNWEVTFEDDFEGADPDRTKWSFNTYWGEQLIGDNFSQQGDLQAYTGGKNVTLNFSRLGIQVRREKSTGKQWLPKAGLVPAEFGYTSDTLSTAGSFWQKEGIFEAKIKFSPVEEVVSSIHLLGKEPGTQVTLLEMGPECRSGIISFNGYQKPSFSGIDLKNLKRGNFYIFSIEWEGHHFVWKINDQVVHEQEVFKMDELLHFNLTSLVVKEIPGSKLPVTFETDWVRCYRRK